MNLGSPDHEFIVAAAAQVYPPFATGTAPPPPASRPTPCHLEARTCNQETIDPEPCDT